MMSTNIVQENELMSSLLKDLKYYVSLLKAGKIRNFSLLLLIILKEHSQTKIKMKV